MLLAVLCEVSAPEKPIAIIVHEPSSGRLVFKGRLTDIYQAWSQALSLKESGVVVTQRSGNVLVRRKVLVTDVSFLAEFLAQAIRYPYLVQELRSVSVVGRLDNVADTLAAQLLK